MAQNLTIWTCSGKISCSHVTQPVTGWESLVTGLIKCVRVRDHRRQQVPDGVFLLREWHPDTRAHKFRGETLTTLDNTYAAASFDLLCASAAAVSSSWTASSACGSGFQIPVSRIWVKHTLSHLFTLDYS